MSSSSGEKNVGRSSLTVAPPLRSQVRTFEREAPEAVISRATISVPTSSRAAESLSLISGVSRVRHFERLGALSLDVGGTVVREDIVGAGQNERGGEVAACATLLGIRRARGMACMSMENVGRQLSSATGRRESSRQSQSWFLATAWLQSFTVMRSTFPTVVDISHSTATGVGSHPSDKP